MSFRVRADFIIPFVLRSEPFVMAQDRLDEESKDERMRRTV